MAPLQTDQLPDTHSASDTDASASRLVVLGTSAGGLHALSVILAGLPPDFPAPVLVVQHLSPTFPSKMAHILSSLTSLHVKEAEEGDQLEAGHIYIAPPDKHLLVSANLTLSLSSSAKVHHCRPSVDVLFCSAAASCGKRTIGVVLTGGDGDGAAGIQAIKAAGGVTIAQDLPSSQQPSMPRSAAATGNVDYILPLPDIAAALVAIVNSKREIGSDTEGGLTGAEGKRTPAAEVFAQPEAAATKSGALEQNAADLAACGEALRVAEEALRVQSDLIASYMLALKAEAAMPARRTQTS